MMTEDIRLALDRVLSEEILAEEYVDKKNCSPETDGRKMYEYLFTLSLLTSNPRRRNHL